MFDLLVIFTRCDAGGTATRLTHGMAYDMQARVTEWQATYTTDAATPRTWDMRRTRTRARPVSVKPTVTIPARGRPTGSGS